jgi:hypothetical protein
VVGTVFVTVVVVVKRRRHQCRRVLPHNTGVLVVRVRRGSPKTLC